MVHQETVELFKKVMEGYKDNIFAAPSDVRDARYKELETAMNEVYKHVSSIDDIRELVKAVPAEMNELMAQWIWWGAKQYKSPPQPIQRSV